MRKLVALLLVGIMMLSLAGCGRDASASSNSSETVAAGTKQTAAEATDEKNGFVNEPGKCRYLDKDYEVDENGVPIIKIYYCMDQYDESTMDEVLAVEQRIEELNAERNDVHLEFLGYSDGQSTVNKQIGDVETAIAMNPDVILLKAVDSNAMIPAIEMAYDAGIYCIEKTGMDTDKVDIHWVGISEPTIGRMLADHVRTYLEEHPDVNFKAGLIWGAPEQVEQLKRLKGLEELAEEMPDRFEIIAQQYGMWETAVAQSTMEDWIQAYPEMNFIATAADQMTLGAVNALNGAGILDDYFIISCNGLTADITLMLEGATKFFAGFITMESDGKMVDAAVSLALGELAGQENKLDNSENATFIATPETLEEYLELKGLSLGDFK